MKGKVRHVALENNWDMFTLYSRGCSVYSVKELSSWGCHKCRGGRNMKLCHTEFLSLFNTDLHKAVHQHYVNEAIYSMDSGAAQK